MTEDQRDALLTPQSVTEDFRKALVSMTADRDVLRQQLQTVCEHASFLEKQIEESLTYLSKELVDRKLRKRNVNVCKAAVMAIDAQAGKIRQALLLIGTQTDCQCQGEADCRWCKIRRTLEN